MEPREIKQSYDYDEFCQLAYSPLYPESSFNIFQKLLKILQHVSDEVSQKGKKKKKSSKTFFEKCWKDE